MKNKLFQALIIGSTSVLLLAGCSLFKSEPESNVELDTSPKEEIADVELEEDLKNEALPIEISDWNIMSHQEAEILYMRDGKPLEIYWEPKGITISRIELLNVEIIKPVCSLGNSFTVYNINSPENIGFLSQNGSFEIPASVTPYLGDHGLYLVKIIDENGETRFSRRPFYTVIDAVLSPAEKVERAHFFDYCTFDPITGEFLSPTIEPLSDNSTLPLVVKSFESLNLNVAEIESNQEMQSQLDLTSIDTPYRIFFNQAQEITLGVNTLHLRMVEAIENSNDEKEFCTSDKKWCERTSSYLTLEIGGSRYKMYRQEIFQLTLNNNNQYLVIAMDIETPPTPSDFMIIPFK